MFNRKYESKIRATNPMHGSPTLYLDCKGNLKTPPCSWHIRLLGCCCLFHSTKYKNMKLQENQGLWEPFLHR